MASMPIAGIQLDLKYLMPHKGYLQRWLREIAGQGINMLLLEYEDKFPFEQYPFLRAEGAFTPDELRAFLATAREAGIAVVPLVQTLSHLEFALAHDELAHLREMPDITTQINPVNPAAIEFVQTLIAEVLAYHDGDDYFHLGADEAWSLGVNPAYSEELKAMGHPAFWARHLKPFIAQLHAAGKRPMVWDDIFWQRPAAILEVDLPRDVVLVSWNYGIRRLKPDNSSLPMVDVYREAGYEVLGAPCLNWGVLQPMHGHCLANTAAWAAKAQQTGCLGLINTSWSSFHTPLATQMPYIAATAALVRDAAHEVAPLTALKVEGTTASAVAVTGDPTMEAEAASPANGTAPQRAATDAWMDEFLAEYYGCDATGVAAALQDLGRNYEQAIEGLCRPLSPIVYGYMDMVLFFKNLEERQRRGVYPLDWNDADFDALYLRKMELLRTGVARAEVSAKLEELHPGYLRAAAAFKELAARATRHHDEAALYAVFAAMKELHVRLVRYFVLGEGDRAALRAEHEVLEQPLRSVLEQFLEPVSVERLMRLWWKPAAAGLA